MFRQRDPSYQPDETDVLLKYAFGHCDVEKIKSLSHMPNFSKFVKVILDDFTVLANLDVLECILPNASISEDHLCVAFTNYSEKLSKELVEQKMKADKVIEHFVRCHPDFELDQNWLHQKMDELNLFPRYPEAYRSFEETFARWKSLQQKQLLTGMTSSSSQSAQLGMPRKM